MLGSRERWKLYAVYAGLALASTAPAGDRTTVGTRVPLPPVGRTVVASTGLSAGGIADTARPSGDDEHGLPTSTPILGAVWVVGIVPFALWLVRPDPAALGWMPDGERVHRDVPAFVATGTPFGEAVHTRFFVATTIAYVLVLGSQVGGIQQLVKLTKHADGHVERESLGEVRFVPLIGDEGWDESS